MTEIKTLDSKVVYQNKWMTVREDVIERSSGKQGVFGVVEKPDFVVILPIDGDHIHLVEQYRYPVKKRYWELPQGAWEESPNIDPKRLAAAELQEETGLETKQLTYVGFQHLAYGYSNQGYHIYLATELNLVGRSLDEEEEGLVTKKVELSEFERMMKMGEITDATSVNAYGLCKLKKLI